MPAMTRDANNNPDASNDPRCQQHHDVSNPRCQQPPMSATPDVSNPRCQQPTMSTTNHGARNNPRRQQFAMSAIIFKTLEVYMRVSRELTKKESTSIHMIFEKLGRNFRRRCVITFDVNL